MTSSANRCFSLLAGVLVAGCAGIAMAQVQSRPATQPIPAPPPGTEVRSAVVHEDAAGDRVIVRSGMPAAQPHQPAPAFSTLDRRQRGYLDENDASAYPLLASDFIHADANRDGRVSKAEYERWSSKP